MSKPGYMTIAGIAELYGVNLRTLRFYEQRSLLAPTRVGNSRLYTERDRIRLALILKAKRLGFSLGQIEKLISASCYHDKESDPFCWLDKSQIHERIDKLERERGRLEVAIAELNAVIATRSEKPDAGAA